MTRSGNVARLIGCCRLVIWCFCAAAEPSFLVIIVECWLNNEGDFDV